MSAALTARDKNRNGIRTFALFAFSAQTNHVGAFGFCTLATQGLRWDQGILLLQLFPQIVGGLKKKRKNSSREKNLMLKKSSGSKCEKFKVHGFHVRMFVHM